MSPIYRPEISCDMSANKPYIRPKIAKNHWIYSWVEFTFKFDVYFGEESIETDNELEAIHCYSYSLILWLKDFFTGIPHKIVEVIRDENQMRTETRIWVRNLKTDVWNSKLTDESKSYKPILHVWLISKDILQTVLLHLIYTFW